MIMLGSLADFDKAILLNPNNLVAYMNRGIVRQLTLDIKGAIEDFTKVININNENAEAYFF
jgi:tetratricopeptide (TPR) repeat protein